MNLLKLTLPNQTKLKVDLGTFEGTGNGVETAADAIEEALVTELAAMKDGLVNPLNARITALEAEVTDARGVFADQIIKLKTLSGVLKADDDEAIKTERAYLLGAEDVEADVGLSTTRLVAEFNRVLSLGAAAPGVQTSNHTPGTLEGVQSANPFFPTAAPVAAPTTQTVRPGGAAA